MAVGQNSQKQRVIPSSIAVTCFSARCGTISTSTSCDYGNDNRSALSGVATAWARIPCAPIPITVNRATFDVTLSCLRRAAATTSSTTCISCNRPCSRLRASIPTWSRAHRPTTPLRQNACLWRTPSSTSSPPSVHVGRQQANYTYDQQESQYQSHKHCASVWISDPEVSRQERRQQSVFHPLNKVTW